MSDPLSDPSRLPIHDIMCIDCKSFYASTEAIKRAEYPTSAKIAVLSREESSGGLILAASPYSKQNYGVKLGTRRFELRDDMDLKLVEPHMKDYIKLNYRINQIYRQFTDDAHWFPYSIDESFIDVSGSHQLFGNNQQIARQIQRRVFDQTGIITTVGIGQNPLLAKLALDNAAKEQTPWIAEWTYDQVPQTIWQIPKITAMWGIGHRSAKSLALMGIYSVADLAHADLNLLKKRFGVLGEQLYYDAWGIDYSTLTKRYVPRAASKGYGNSQILMRDYIKPVDLQVVLEEVTDQVATRLRNNHVVTELISLHIGFADVDKSNRTHFSAQMHVEATNDTKQLTSAIWYLLGTKWDGSPVRQVGVRCAKISTQRMTQFSLFEDPEVTLHRQQLSITIDRIRKRFGYKALVRASSLTPGGTAIERSGLVGGHHA
ncbi:DNA polymerase [Lactobacillus sp. LC28-10]|uniref:DNA polymerase n=1 Tax=Secundilactobacillus angelensis TaxID=2722706 RepID=A0ABX1L295_9LACO|nr:DNA polymerase [Secundilactobacillus angelensis]MCH5461333.1 DNA polymerase [Secundilactobacillus angelensis]NLR19585.1 DNA polymerase [Secundilactobacillus angelensis]